MNHDCTMRDELTEMVKSLQNSVKWTLGICAGAILFLVIATATIQAKQTAQEAWLQKINDNYAPLILIQDISKDNSNLIKILQMLPETTKDDPRYINAVNESQSFQTEALRRAAITKRSAGGTGIGGLE